MTAKQTMAGVGIGWAAGAITALATYAIQVPSPLNAFFPFLVGLGVTLFWLNK